MGKMHFFQVCQPISHFEVPVAFRTWTSILLSAVGGVRGQILVQIGLKLGEKLTVFWAFPG